MIELIKYYKSGYLLVAIAMALLTVSCSEQKDNKPDTPLEMTLAAEMSLLPATLWVAEARGYFDDENLNLTIKEFDSGRNALEAMLKDSAINMSTVAQTPVVFNSFKNEPYVIVATMAYSIDDVKILARKDHGINDVNDLKGKKVGATLRSTGHYFLEGFLENYGLGLDDIDLYDVNASGLKDRLISGELDAITSWEPHIYNTRKILDESKLSLFINKLPFRKDFYFTVGRSYAENEAESVRRFLRAVIRAEKFIRYNKEEAQSIVSSRLKVDYDIVKSIWDSFTFSISLEQSILVGLEDEAEWALDIQAVEGVPPNYLDFINIDILQSVHPDVVNIIH